MAAAAFTFCADGYYPSEPRALSALREPPPKVRKPLSSVHRGRRVWISRGWNATQSLGCDVLCSPYGGRINQIGRRGHSRTEKCRGSGPETRAHFDFPRSTHHLLSLRTAVL